MLYTSNSFVAYNYPLNEADAVFLGIPFASASIGKPALYGPLMVRESLKLTEDFINNVNIFEKVKICDLGDIEIVPGSFELTAKRIRETIVDIKNENKNAFPVFVGGEHSITLPVAETLKPKTIIQIDAHSDTRKDYLENKYTHQAWAYHASKFAKIIQIGVRTWNREEAEFVKKGKNIEVSTIKDILKKNLERPVHLTVDVDVFAPPYIETGLPEGDMRPQDIFPMLEKIKFDSMDITEIADDRLPSKTGFLAAEIIKQVLYKKFSK